jgi:hypothetical protein
LPATQYYKIKAGKMPSAKGLEKGEISKKGEKNEIRRN